jgi:hypothetical protein
MRPLESTKGVEGASSSFREVDDILALSPMLVGGVEEEDCAFETLSTVMTLLIESDEDARVRSARPDGCNDVSILSTMTESIAFDIRCRVEWKCIC